MEPGRLMGIVLLTGAVAFAAPYRGTADPRATLAIDSAIAHERLGQNREAIVELTGVLRGRLPWSDRVRAVFDRGVAYDALGDTKSALADYSEAIRLDRQFAPAYNNRGNVYRRQGRLPEARRDYIAALSCRDVSREYPLYGLGQIAEKEGNAAMAREFYTKALAADPGYVLAAQSLWALRQRADAAPARRAAESNPARRAAESKKPHREALHRPSPPHLRDAILDRRARIAMVQLGAFRDQASAQTAWAKIQALDIPTLKSQVPEIAPVDIPDKGRYWRLRVSAPEGVPASRICDEMASRHLACFPVNG